MLQFLHTSLPIYLFTWQKISISQNITYVCKVVCNLYIIYTNHKILSPYFYTVWNLKKYNAAVIKWKHHCWSSCVRYVTKCTLGSVLKNIKHLHIKNIFFNTPIAGWPPLDHLLSVNQNRLIWQGPCLSKYMCINV